MRAPYYIYSDSLGEMVVESFLYKKKHYKWNDLDCVYYAENSDEEDFFFEIPEEAIY